MGGNSDGFFSLNIYEGTLKKLEYGSWFNVDLTQTAQYLKRITVGVLITFDSKCYLDRYQNKIIWNIENQ